MRPETTRLLNVIQMLSEAAICVGYLFGLIPFMYLWSSGWLVPLAFVSVVVALLARNGTLTLTIVNLALAFLSYIPLVGYLFRIAGMVICIMNIRTITRR